jgi:hypothetical protein
MKVFSVQIGHEEAQETQKEGIEFSTNAAGL